MWPIAREPSVAAGRGARVCARARVCAGVCARVCSQARAGRVQSFMLTSDFCEWNHSASVAAFTEFSNRSLAREPR